MLFTSRNGRAWPRWMLSMSLLLLVAVLDSTGNAQETRSMDQDKADVFAFLKRFMQAVEQDAFLEPDQLREVLGIEVIEWTRDENVAPFHRHTTRFKTNVPIIDTTDIANRLRYSIVPRERRYVFGIDRMAHVICLTQAEVVAALGEPEVYYGSSPHGGKFRRVGFGYSFPSSSFRSKVAGFYYISAGGRACLDAVLLLPIPLKPPPSPLKR